MQLTNDDLERVLKQAQESARLAHSAVGLLGGLLFPPEDVEEPPARWMLLDLWNDAMNMAMLSTHRAGNAIQILQDGAAESDSLVDLQDDIARTATRLTMIQATTPGLADPDATVFLYKPDDE